MKIRVMSDSGIVDFDEKDLVKAQAEFAKEKVKVEKYKITGEEDEIIPYANIHKCYNDLPPFKPCEMIEEQHAKREGLI